MNSTLHIAKAEIHIHLEATITPDLCRKLATKNNEIVLTDIGELVLAAYIRLYNTIEPLVKPSLGQIKSWKPYGQLPSTR